VIRLSAATFDADQPQVAVCGSAALL